jgi:short-subunit dehydrogenase
MFFYIIILSNYNEKKLHCYNIGKTLLLFLYNSAKQTSKRKQMNYALITGSSGTIGEAITRKVLALGYHVVGVSRHNSFNDYTHNTFEHIACDLSDTQALQKLCDELKKREFSLVVHCAGFGEFAPHEELSFETIHAMNSVNLLAPMCITNATLRSLKKNGGYLININSIEALRASKFAALYSATKAGLKAFGDALFEETRKSDLSITNINPDMTEGSFYENLRFETTHKEDEKLVAEDIANAITHILTLRKGAVVSEYTLRSLKFGIKKKVKK